MRLGMREAALSMSLVAGMTLAADEACLQPTEIARHEAVGYTMDPQTFTIGALDVYLNDDPSQSPSFSKATSASTVDTIRQGADLVQKATLGRERFEVTSLPAVKLGVKLDDTFEQCIFEIDEVARDIRRALPENDRQPDILAMRIHGASLCMNLGKASLAEQAFAYTPIAVIPQDNLRYLAGHELSHVRGGAHEQTLATTEQDVFTEQSTATQYDRPDGTTLLGTRIPYDVQKYMASDLLTGHNLLQLGVLKPEEVATITQPGQYRVRLQDLYGDSSNSAFRLLRIPLNDSKNSWLKNGNNSTLDFRAPSYLYVEMRTTDPKGQTSFLQVARGGPASPGLDDKVYTFKNQKRGLGRHIIYKDSADKISISTSSPSMSSSEQTEITVTVSPATAR